MRTCCNCWSRSSVRCFPALPTEKAAGRRISCWCASTAALPSAALYWTLYLLLFDTTPRVFYVSEFGWVASVIFLRILQATLAGADERSFRCRRAWLAPAFGVPLLAFYCTFGDILSNLIWCGMMIWLSFCAIRGLVYANGQTGAARNMRYFT